MKHKKEEKTQFIVKDLEFSDPKPIL
jgi:rRNA biogenesis protein RRP5